MTDWERIDKGMNVSAQIKVGVAFVLFFLLVKMEWQLTSKSLPRGGFGQKDGGNKEA